METKKFVFVFAVIVSVALLISYFNRHVETTETIVERVKIDTIYINSPVAHDTIKVDRVVRIPIQDCDISEDDSFVVIPCAEQKHYVDSMYEAWVSGIDVALDSIHVLNKTRIIEVTRTNTITKSAFMTEKDKPLHLGGFVSANSGLNLSHFNIQGGLELRIKSFDIKTGVNIGENFYPYIGAEFHIR